MINQARHIATTTVRAVAQEEYDPDWLRKAHSALMAIIAILFITLVVMWGLNVSGAKGVNGFFFWGGIAFLIGKSLLPAVIGTAGFLGAFVAWLNDKDKSQGVLKGLKVLAQVVENLAFIWMSAAFILWTFSYQNTPLGNFWLHLSGVSLLVLIARRLGFNGKTGTFILGGYVIAVLGVSIWSDHIPNKVKGDASFEFKLPSFATEGGDSTKTVEVNLAKEDVVIIHNVELDTVFAVVLPVTNDRKHGAGVVYWGCPKAIKPVKTVEPALFEVVGGGQQAVNHSQLTKKAQDSLREQGAKIVSVEYTRKLAHISANPCSFLQYGGK